MNIIKVENLSKTFQYYKKQPGLLAAFKDLFVRKKLFSEAVKNISFTIKEGELVGFLGPNGAGKTTTLKMLSGILYPTNGLVEVMGFTPWQRKKKYQKQFSIVMGQKNQLWWDLPAIDSFMLNKEIYEINDTDFKSALDELSELLDIKDKLDVQVRKLSLGERMKCELIAALLHRPKVIFLDEPTIGLDVVAQKNVRDFIKKYNKLNKTTIILTSHYMDDIRELCERVIIINHGIVIYDGQLNDLILKYAPHKMLKITFNEDGVKESDVKKYGKIIEFNPYMVSMEVDRNKIKDVASKILSSNLPVDDIMIDEVDIDLIIMKIFALNK